MAVARAIAFVAVLMMGITAVTVASGPGAPGPLAPPVAEAGTLTAFASCDDLVARYRDIAERRVGPYGLSGGFGGPAGMWPMAEGLERDSAVAAEEASVADSAAGSASAASATNVQEAGIDEPDLVKTDGRFVYAVAQGRLQVVDVRGAAPQRLADVALPGHGAQLLVDGDRLLAATHDERPAAEPPAAEPPAAEPPAAEPPGSGTQIDGDVRIGLPGTPQTVLSLYDISAGVPRLLSTLAVDGALVSARVVDGRARVVLRSEPTIPFPPLPGSFLPDEALPPAPTPADEQAAVERNRRIVREAGVEAWLPSYRLSDATGAEVAAGQLLDCADVSHDDQDSLTTLSVVAVDLRDSLAPTGAAGIMADGQTVSATDSRLHVAVGRWPAAMPMPEGPVTDAPMPDVAMPDDAVTSMIAPAPSGPEHTDIHAFDLTDPSGARYVASGTVEGRLVNQFALSERDGVLRVAVTTGPQFAAPGQEESQSSVITLTESGDELVELGRVDGLGVTEQIQSVRFLGDVAYVVTFRRTDPLYTVDLSDPSAPRVLGELKIPGYSAYLHPLDDLAPGRLLGVGQDATAEGVTTGLQLSLFDVADLAAPRRIATAGIAGASTPVEWDHHAFLWWAPRSLAVVPYERYAYDPASGAEDVETGAVLYRLTADGLAEAGRVSHTGQPGVTDPWMGTVQRAVVAGERLYTVSEAGIAGTDLDTLAATGWAGFAP